MPDDASQPSGSSTASLEPAWDALPVPVCCVALPGHRILYVNPAFTTLFGYKAVDLTTIEGWAPALALGQSPAISAAAANREAEQWSPASVETCVRAQDGTDKTVLYRTANLPSGYALLTFEDISQRKKGELALREAERVARESERPSSTLLAYSHEMIVISPKGVKPAFASPGVQEITGWTEQEYVTKDLLETVHPEDRARVEEIRRSVLQEGLAQHLRYRTLMKDGGYCWVEGYAAALRDPAGAVGGYVLTLRDIAKQKEQEDTLAFENSQLAQLAQLDELTGIANRRVFKSALAREARRKSRSSQALALLMLDVDNFKKYNDLYGHMQGDACLRQVAQTLKKVLLRVADLVARYGGEEFVLLLPMTEPEGAERVAQNILQAVAALRIPHAGTPFGIVTVSIGVSTWGLSSTMDEDRLIEEADRALYRAKHQGRNTYSVSHCLGDAAKESNSPILD